jgi:signal transduction histidine kinase
MALAREELDLVALVHDAIEAARPALSNARCTVSVEADGPVCGRWDRQRLMQTLADLLSNAYKYGGTRPIALRVERGAERARLVVRDQGIGIASEDQGRIFERFERSAVTFEAWGLGLGLWTARLAVEAHGGSIAVRSEVGRGATFIVELPYDG